MVRVRGSHVVVVIHTRSCGGYTSAHSRRLTAEDGLKAEKRMVAERFFVLRIFLHLVALATGH